MDPLQNPMEVMPMASLALLLLFNTQQALELSTDVFMKEDDSNDGLPSMQLLGVIVIGDG